MRHHGVTAVGVLLALGSNISAQDRSPATIPRPAAADLSQYASASLSNQFLKVTFFLPDRDAGYYRGTRFDWSGLISRVDYAGHPLNSNRL
jgi:hypothetical protein